MTVMEGSRRLLRSFTVLIAAAGLATIGTIPSAWSSPPGFPDLDAFTEVPAGVDFSHPEKSANGYAYFNTPDGLHCMVVSLNRYSGNLPGPPVGKFVLQPSGSWAF